MIWCQIVANILSDQPSLYLLHCVLNKTIKIYNLSWYSFPQRDIRRGEDRSFLDNLVYKAAVKKRRAEAVAPYQPPKSERYFVLVLE